MLNNSYKNISKVTNERKVFFQENDPKDIWSDVVQNDSQSMEDLSKAMSHLVYEIGVPKSIVHLSAKVLYNCIYKKWGHYINESDYLASRCPDISASLMAFLQRQYTLAHMGCSVVMAWDEKTNEMLCFRGLDWKGADDIAKATRRFSFVNKQNKEVAQIAGITAMVGVLTGAKKGFSIAINYAPWKRSSKFKSDPTFLIRQLLEDESINSYELALQKVSSWEAGSPCFISICGVKKGEACVIELGREDMHIRKMKDANFLIQTNHYDLETSPFTMHNKKPYEDKMSEKEWYSSELLENSQKREQIIKAKLEEKSSLSMNDRLINIFQEVPILNYETAQWTLMKPLSGKIEVYACVDK